MGAFKRLGWLSNKLSRPSAWLTKTGASSPSAPIDKRQPDSSGSCRAMTGYAETSQVTEQNTSLPCTMASTRDAGISVQEAKGQTRVG